MTDREKQECVAAARRMFPQVNAANEKAAVDRLAQLREMNRQRVAAFRARRRSAMSANP